MAWFLKFYRHDECGVSWTDEWSCACNDRCPICDAEIEPYLYREKTIVIEKDSSGRNWLVFVSPETAEDDPEYVTYEFKFKYQALAFAKSERERIGREG